MVRSTRMFVGFAALFVLCGAVTPASAGTFVVRTAGGGLNIRSGPGLGYGILRVVANGTPVNAVAVSGAWTRINRPATGWVLTAYLRSVTTTYGSHPPGDPTVARILYQEWLARRASYKVLLAMFEAAFTESGMRNLTYGDRDSVGVFQMRLMYFSWAEATNVQLEARWFLRTAIPLERYYSTSGRLAQAVERSAAGWKYDTNRGYAEAWIRYVRGW